VYLPPISSPWGSIFGYARQIGSSRASRVPGHPRLQSVSLLQPTGPHHRILAVRSTSHRYRALRTRFSVTCTKSAPLVHLGFQATHAFNPSLSRSLLTPTTAFWRLRAPPTDIEPVGHEFWSRAPNQPLSCVSGSTLLTPSNSISPVA
jgi:hypothetical protein